MIDQYMDFTLPSEEIEVLRDLEQSIGSNWSSDNFRVEDNHVVRIEVTRGNLNSLPENIGNCKKLKQLLCYGNKIESLPYSLGELTNLEWLGAAQNQTPCKQPLRSRPYCAGRRSCSRPHHSSPATRKRRNENPERSFDQRSWPAPGRTRCQCQA